MYVLVQYEKQTVVVSHYRATVNCLGNTNIETSMAPQVASNKWGKSSMGKHMSKQLERWYGDEINLNHTVKLQEKKWLEMKRNTKNFAEFPLGNLRPNVKSKSILFPFQMEKPTFPQANAKSLFRLHTSIVYKILTVIHASNKTSDKEHNSRQTKKKADIQTHTE